MGQGSSRPSRRRFVQGAGAVGLALGAGCRWLPPQQQPAKVHRIGYLSPGVRQPYMEGLRQGLQELGYTDGGNLAIDWRLADGDSNRLAAFAADLVRSEVDVTVAFGDLAIRALKNATSTVPIVMVNSRDPVSSGFVASLARPGGNVTGLSTMRAPLAGKRLELLKDTAPAASRVALLWNRSVADLSTEYRETEEAAQSLRVQLQSFGVEGSGDFERAFGDMLREQAEGLLVLSDVLMTRNTERIVAFAAQARLPAMFGHREYADAGGLMAYGPSRIDGLHQAAYYVDRILKGAQPAELPVEQPTKFDLAINLKTAQALGLTIPPHVLAQATEVIR
jgi:putative tryptophan/tyrosine transport system substrate-binding protein